MSRQKPELGLWVAAAVAACSAGCAGSGSRGAAADTPDTAKPGLIAMTVSDFTDTNINGYRDSTSAAVYVYAHNYPIPMRVRGAFEFRLLSRDGRELAKWTFDEAQAAKVQYDLAPGPGFIFDLNLLAQGSDQLEENEGELVCTYLPAEGPSLRTRPSGPVQVGPLSRRSSGRGEPLGR